MLIAPIILCKFKSVEINLKSLFQYFQSITGRKSLRLGQGPHDDGKEYTDFKVDRMEVNPGSKFAIVFLKDDVVFSGDQKIHFYLNLHFRN